MGLGCRKGRIAVAAIAGMLTGPVLAQEAPVGPCSPYRAADGDIPSEMPGCARHLRPAPGSLADEMQFRRARRSAEADDGATPDEDAPLPARRRGRRERP